MTFYRRDLPHLQRDFKADFVTFVTDRRWIFPCATRDVVLASCLHDHDEKIQLHAAVVMPDHVHLIFTPMINETEKYVYSLAEIMGGIKGASAHQINEILRRKGRSEHLEDRIQYVVENPLRLGLVKNWKEYRWLWAPLFDGRTNSGERCSPCPAEGG
jgi:REP element-mobilizing transposase RayT